MKRATDERWKSKFSRFVSSFGATTLAEQLEVDRSAIYRWIRGVNAPDHFLAKIQFLECLKTVVADRLG